MRNDFESNYLEHSAKGTTWKNVKYFKKVMGPNGKYIYFYSQAAFDAYNRRFSSEGRNARKNPNELPKDVLDKKNLTSKVKPDVKTLEQKKKQTANLIVAGKKAATAPALGQKAAQTKMKDASELSAAGKAKADEILAKANGETDSKSKKKSGSGSSKKKSGSGSSSKKSSGSGSSSKKSGGSGKGSSSSSKEKAATKEKGTAKEKATTKSKAASNGKVVKGERPTGRTDDILDKFSEDINTYDSSEEMLSNMKSYKDGSFGYITAGDAIYKWEKVNGEIIMIDIETNEEVSINEYLAEAKSIKEVTVHTDRNKRK